MCDYHVYDTALLGILQKEGQIAEFLDVVMGFLYRRTDLFHVMKSKDETLGFPPGVAPRLLTTAYEKYEVMSKKRDLTKEERTIIAATKGTSVKPATPAQTTNQSPAADSEVLPEPADIGGPSAITNVPDPGTTVPDMAVEEKVASTALFPCKYLSEGCTLQLLHTEKTAHEDVCEFRPYSCPCLGAACKWQGSLDNVKPHLLSLHKSITMLPGEDIVFLATDVNLPGAVDWVMMQSCFGHSFMLVLEKQEEYEGHQMFYAIVHLIGTRKQAENFAYRLELNGLKRRLTWEATPRSIHDGVQSAIQNSDCLVFDADIARLFADSGNLGINVTISTRS